MLMLYPCEDPLEPPPTFSICLLNYHLQGLKCVQIFGDECLAQAWEVNSLQKSDCTPQQDSLPHKPKNPVFLSHVTCGGSWSHQELLEEKPRKKKKFGVVGKQKDKKFPVLLLAASLLPPALQSINI